MSDPCRKLLTLSDIQAAYEPQRASKQPALPSMNRRIKAAIYLACFLLFLVAAVSSVNSAWTSGSVPANTKASYIVVGDGQTLWSIASHIAGTQGNVEGVEAWIEQHNALQDGQVVAGQTLVVPVK